MDLIKLQTEMLNQKFPIYPTRKPLYYLDPIEGKYYIGPDLHFLFVADVDSIMLDMQKVGTECINCMSIWELTERAAKTELKLKENTIVKVPDCYGKKAVYLEADALKVMVNEAYLKLITKNEKNVQYFGSGEMAPVLIKANDNIIGVIAPLKQNGV